MIAAAAPGWAGEPLSVTASFSADSQVGAREPIALTVSRPLAAADGRLAIFLGSTDLTALFAVDGAVWRYRAELQPLPVGQHVVTVYLFVTDESWDELGAFGLNVGEPAAPGADAGDATASATPRHWTPSASVSVENLSTPGHEPDSNRPARTSATDVSGQVGLRAELGTGAVTFLGQADVVGFSHRPQSLRYGELGDDAPQVDLSSYMLQVDVKGLQLQVGHAGFGSHRYLVDGFQSRGVVGRLKVARGLDLAVAALNGTSIVGWSNILGLQSGEHRVYGGTLGIELLPSRPGGLRVEIDSVDGSLKPLASYNAALLNDAETSNGLGARVLASDAPGRFRLDAGVARSRYTNPADELLDPDGVAVAVQSVTADALYAEVSGQLLRDHGRSERWKTNLTLGARWSRVDPLYRSVAAFAAADREDAQVDVAAGFGAITLSGGYMDGRDNLGEVASILRTATDRAFAALSLPLAAVFNVAENAAGAVPRLSYACDRTHQRGETLPVNGDFDAASIPDQVASNQVATVDWQLKDWSLGYRYNRSFVDNRQIGREDADILNQVHGVSVGLRPHERVNLTLDVSAERSYNSENLERYEILRGTAGIQAKTTARSTLALSLGGTLEGDLGDQSESRNLNYDVRWSLAFERRKGHFGGELFVRYADIYARSYDRVFALDSMTRLKTVNAGLRLSLF